MTSLTPAAAWNALWDSHHQTKDLLTLKVLRRGTGGDSSGGSHAVGNRADAELVIEQARERAAELERLDGAAEL